MGNFLENVVSYNDFISKITLLNYSFKSNVKTCKIFLTSNLASDRENTTE